MRSDTSIVSLVGRLFTKITWSHQTPLGRHRALLLQAPLQLDLLTNNLRIEPFQDFDAVPTAPHTSQNVLLDKPL